MRSLAVHRVIFLSVSESCRLGQIDPEPVPSALIATGHFG